LIPTSHIVEVPEVELQILGIALNVDEIVHKIIQTAWLSLVRKLFQPPDQKDSPAEAYC
jgi:hypothetical protein